MSVDKNYLPDPRIPTAGEWTTVLRSQAGTWWEWRMQLADVWQYRDLLWMFVRRDFVSVYKQTILGPLWFFLQPLLTTTTLAVIFSGLAKVSTQGMPPMLFYLAATTPWNCFATAVTKTSMTFISNQPLFSKVYFPRLIVPISVVISNLIQLVIQLGLFLGFLLTYLSRGYPVHPDWLLVGWLTPCLMLLLGLLGLGCGMIVSTLILIYRDLASMVAFLVQIAMFITPVIFPLASVPKQYLFWFELNPMSAVVETFRAIFLGGSVPWLLLGQSTMTTLIIGVVGLAFFTRTERNYVELL